MRTALAATLFACAIPAQVPPPDRWTEGRVVDVLGDAVPAADIAVVVDGRVTGRSASDGDGLYRVRIRNGADLHVSAPGKTSVRLPWRGALTPIVRHAVLEDAATVHGRVVGGDGLALADATVVAVAPGHAAATTVTDAHGHYVLEHVPLRLVHVHAFRGGVSTVRAVQLANDTEIVLELAGDTRGSAVAVHNLPAPAIAATRLRVYGNDVRAVADAGRVPLRADGTANVAVHTDCMLVALAADWQFEPSMRLVTSSTRQTQFTGVAGRTASLKVPVRVRTVTDQPVSPLQFVVHDRSHLEIGSITADANGAMVLRAAVPIDGFVRIGLPLGKWLLQGDENVVADGCSWVPLYGADRAADLHVAPAAIVRGAVGFAGQLLPFAEVVIVDEERDHAAMVRTWLRGDAMLATGLPLGRYHLLAIGGDGRLLRAELQLESLLEHAPEWQQVAAGSVEGVVRDASGPRPGVELVVAHAELQAGIAVHAARRQLCRAVTDRHGRFRVRGMQTGTWTIAGARDDAGVPLHQVDVADRQRVTVDIACAR
jgi:hypothetical protein